MAHWGSTSSGGGDYGRAPTKADGATGPWTLDEWLALPDGPPYTELVDGLLVMSPVSAYRHQRLLDGDYVECARSEDGLLQLDRPFSVRLDLTLPDPPAVG
ncbi:MAG: hypothetical protein ACRDUV_25845 [Pseudonocardiaceae bacterium]